MEEQITYFDETLLGDNILDALYDMRFEKCTPIQAACIDPIIEGRDIMGVAQTGTGKTAAYLLPVLSMLDEGDYSEENVNCLIMSPTRELAQQIDQAQQGFGYYLSGISSVAVYGGGDGSRYEQEASALSKGASIVIATPGRLMSHMQMGHLDLSHLSFFILDEADRMLDMGFSEDILNIAKHIPSSCQTIMFSATMPQKIEQMAAQLLHDPLTVKLAVSKPAEKIRQSAYVCYDDQKIKILTHLFKSAANAADMKRCIIFSGKKQRVKEITRSLKQKQVSCGEMHSDLTQEERDAIMYSFKSGEIDVLIATDIVSRGIDIDDISIVINFDVPHDVEDYVHRIGRTARAQRDGCAITLVSPNDVRLFQHIEEFLEKEIEKTPVPESLGAAPSYEPVAKKSRNSGKSRGEHSSQRAKGNKRHSQHKRQHSDNNKASAQSKLINKNKSSEKPQTTDKSQTAEKVKSDKNKTTENKLHNADTNNKSKNPKHHDRKRKRVRTPQEGLPLDCTGKAN